MAQNYEVVNGKIRVPLKDGRTAIITKKASGGMDITAPTSPEELDSLMAVQTAAEQSQLASPSQVAEYQKQQAAQGQPNRDDFAVPTSAPQAEVQQSAIQQPQAATSAVQSVESTMAPRISQESINMLQQGSEKKRSALLPEAKAQIKEVESVVAQQKTQLEALDSIAKAEATREQNAQQKLEEMRLGYEQSIQDMRDFKIDPNRFMQNSGTAGKVAAAVAVALGAVGAGITGGKNQALEIVNGAIDRDIDAQKMAFEQKKSVAGAKQNLFSMYMNQMGDARSASLAAKTAMLESYRMRLELAANSTKSASIMAAYQKADGAALEEIAKNRIELEKAMSDKVTFKSESKPSSPADWNKAVGEIRGQIAQNKPLQNHLNVKNALSTIQRFQEGGLSGLATIKLISDVLNQGSFGTEMQSIADRANLRTMTENQLARFAGEAQGKVFINQAMKAIAQQVSAEEVELAPVLSSFDQQARSLGMGLENLVGASVGRSKSKGLGEGSGDKRVK